MEGENRHIPKEKIEKKEEDKKEKEIALNQLKKDLKNFSSLTINQLEEKFKKEQKEDEWPEILDWQSAEKAKILECLTRLDLPVIDIGSSFGVKRTEYTKYKVEDGKILLENHIKSDNHHYDTKNEILLETPAFIEYYSDLADSSMGSRGDRRIIFHIFDKNKNEEKIEFGYKWDSFPNPTESEDMKEYREKEKERQGENKIKYDLLDDVINEIKKLKQ